MKPGGLLICLIFVLEFVNIFGKEAKQKKNEPRVKFSKKVLNNYKERVKAMFYHAYDNYIYNAYPYDELKPITCRGFDTWGSYSLTLIDSLDMLVILGNRTEFERVVDLIGKTIKFNKDINVSVFETNIRVIGGLLSAHLLSYRLYMEENSSFLNVSEHLHPEWPCDGPLLRMAVDVAKKILPAFNTTTGMPYGTINLVRGVPIGETSETCVAGVGTFIIEFATLSRLTGDPIYEKLALRAMDSLWKLRSSLDLIGNHIDVQTGRWTGLDSTIGSGVDSYFEYLVKGGILLNEPDFLKQFKIYQNAINKFLSHDDWFVWSNMDKGHKTLPLFSSLEAFYPGLLTLTGDLEHATKLINSYHKIWRKFGGLPEFYNIQTNSIHSNRENYPLRPELIESIMYVLRATNNDESFYEMAVDYLEAIEHISKLDCGFATVKSVKDHRLENRMESFFLAETIKYLYLIFDEENFLHSDLSADSAKMISNKNGECLIETGFFLFNTEAHPIDGSSLECCRALNSKKKLEKHQEYNILSNLNLNKLIDRFIDLKSDSKKNLEKKFNKTMNEEFRDLKTELENELKSYEDKQNNFCQKEKTNKPNNSLNNDEPGTLIAKLNPFLCSLNNTFQLQVSFLNSQNFYP